MPAAFARSCEIKIDALDHGRGSMAGRRGAWKIRKQCQGSRSRAKYLAARKFHFKFLILRDCAK